MITFAQVKDPNEVLNEWSSNIDKLMHLVNKVDHIINKEQMIHEESQLVKQVQDATLDGQKGAFNLEYEDDDSADSGHDQYSDSEVELSDTMDID